MWRGQCGDSPDTNDEILGGIMAKYQTRKATPQAKAQTVQRRKVRATKQGAVRTTRSGRIAR